MIKPPFRGASDVFTFSIDDVLKKLDMQVLFKSRWKMAKGGEEMFTDLVEDDRILASMNPQAIYGYFPVHSLDNKLILNDSIIWEFPMIKGKTIPRYFRTEAEGGDMIPLTAVTIGEKAVVLSKELYEKNDYAEYFLLYGLAAEVTETLAEMVNERINNELGLQKTLRRSFGYPACPDLSYQKSLLELLKAERMSLILSESNQLIPEFSTTAFIIREMS